MDNSRGELLAILTSALDCLDENVSLVESTGRILHENLAMRHMLGNWVVAAELRDRMCQLARSLVGGGGGEGGAERPLSRSRPALGETLEQHLAVYDGRVCLRARWIGGSPQAEDSFVLVFVQQVAEEPSTTEALRQRFFLTCQEARVALLLARRRSNEEIARELRVSPHTARHHTERILSKLGVHSRMQVAAVVGETTAPHVGAPWTA